MVSRTLFHATKSSAHTPLDNFCSVIEPLSSILQIQIQILNEMFPQFVEKWNSSGKTEQWYINTEQWYKYTIPFSFCCGKNGTVVQKTEQWCQNGAMVQKHGTVVQNTEQNGTKTEQCVFAPLFCFFFALLFRFPTTVFVPLWKNRNSSGKNRTVVQKHGTVVHNTLFRFCSVVEKKRNSSAKNGTVVRKHGTVVQNTLFRFCSVVKNGTVVQKYGRVVQKTEQWYDNTEQWCKNGTVLQKHDIVVQNTLFRFCSIVEKTEQ